MTTTIVALLLCLISVASAAPDRPIDAGLAKDALVVMRAKKISDSPETDKYRWSEVEVVEVFENRAEWIFPNTIKVATLSSKPGIPDGVSTLYIERYGDAGKNWWKLVGGSATAGVSHVLK